MKPLPQATRDLPQAPSTQQAPNIHPTAIVAPGARIPASSTVGPYCIVGANVTVGENCRLHSHVVLAGDDVGVVTLGDNNTVYPFACLGISPQDLKYAGEPTRLTIGSGNTVREYVTISRGTVGGGGETTVRDNCLIMAYTHIGHDCHIGSGCILANSATLAGHVTVEDYATVGALCPVHQFCRIGRYAYVGGGTTITQDVLPYSLTSIERNNHAYGLNKVGLERRGFTPAQMRALRQAYRLLQASKLNTTDAIAAIRSTLLGESSAEAGESGSAAPDPSVAEHVAYLAEFIASSERGVIK